MKNEIRICGGTKEFEAVILAASDGKTPIARYASPEDALNAGDMECAAYFIMPDYENGARSVPEMDFETAAKFAALKTKGQRLFIENYMACDYLHSAIFGLQIDGLERHFLDECVVADDEQALQMNGRILQARGSYYHPARALYNGDYGNKILLSVSDCVGTHTVYKEGSFKRPLLLKTANFLCSVMNMSDYDRTKMLPSFRWKAVYAFILNETLDVERSRAEAAFERLHHPVGIYGRSANTVENAVEKAVKWHFSAGLLRDADGSKGMYEMITSFNLRPRANIRTDAEMLTGLLLCAYGVRKGDDRLVGTGRNLIRFLLDNGIQIEEGETAGMFKWFHDLDVGPRYVWSSDTSRAGLALINMYKLFKETEYLDRSRRLGDAMLRWLGPEGLLSGWLYIKDGFSKSQAPEHLTDNPVYYGEMTSFLLQLYKCTGDAKYRDAVLKYADRISAKFPDIKPFGFSDNFTYSRYLLMLASIQKMLDVDLSGRINGCLKFFKALQHKSGGIRETPIRLVDHAEAGVGIGDASDNIADMLYCNNFVLCALSIICGMERPHSIDLDLARDLHGKLKDFILAIQIKDRDPRFDGGWMRAFDMDHGEYYGLNKDKDWGAYCIMAGWITGFIPLALLHEPGGPSIFS